jgi:hypothetical protein
MLRLFDESEWFLIPADGSKPVATGAAERLRAVRQCFSFSLFSEIGRSSVVPSCYEAIYGISSSRPETGALAALHGS